MFNLSAVKVAFTLVSTFMAGLGIYKFLITAPSLTEEYIRNVSVGWLHQLLALIILISSIILSSHLLFSLQTVLFFAALTYAFFELYHHSFIYLIQAIILILLDSKISDPLKHSYSSILNFPLTQFSGNDPRIAPSLFKYRQTLFFSYE